MAAASKSLRAAAVLVLVLLEASGASQLLTSAVRSGQRVRRVFNGFETVLGEFPFCVLTAVWTGVANINCSGTLISDNHVLTAAHCYGDDGTVSLPLSLPRSQRHADSLTWPLFRRGAGRERQVRVGAGRERLLGAEGLHQGVHPVRPGRRRLVPRHHAGEAQARFLLQLLRQQDRPRRQGQVKHPPGRFSPTRSRRDSASVRACSSLGADWEAVGTFVGFGVTSSTPTRLSLQRKMVVSVKPVLRLNFSLASSDVVKRYHKVVSLSGGGTGSRSCKAFLAQVRVPRRLRRPSGDRRRAVRDPERRIAAEPTIALRPQPAERVHVRGLLQGLDRS